MILHSIISPSDIFCNMDNVPAAVYKRVGCGLVELDGTKVRRLISTDPAAYLDKRYAPGAELSGKKTDTALSR